MTNKKETKKTEEMRDMEDRYNGDLKIMFKGGELETINRNDYDDYFPKTIGNLAFWVVTYRGQWIVLYNMEDIKTIWVMDD